MKLLNKFAFLLLTIALGFVVTACNTIEGVGKDIKKAGQSIEGAAEKAK
jgi:predicted small secreted protein